MPTLVPESTANHSPVAHRWDWRHGSAQVSLVAAQGTDEAWLSGRILDLRGLDKASRSRLLLETAQRIAATRWLSPGVQEEWLVVMRRIEASDVDQLDAVLREFAALSDSLDDAYQGQAVAPPADGVTPREATRAPATQDTHNPSDDGIPLVPWDDDVLKSSGVLQRWAQELKAAWAEGPNASQPDAPPIPQTLLDVGRAGVIQTDNWLAAACGAKRIAADLGLPFVAVSHDNMAEVLLGLAKTGKRMVLFMAGEHGWCKADLDGQDSAEEFERLRGSNELAQLLTAPAARAKIIRGILLHHRLPTFVLITHISDISQFSQTLSGPGLFDRRFGMPPLTHAVVGQRLLKDIGWDLCSPTLQQQAAKVSLYLRENSPLKRQSDLHQLRRLQRRLGRPLEFADIITATHVQFLERDDSYANDDATAQHKRRLVAWHEAGHAAMEMIHSKGQTIPEHATIIGSGSVGGFVMLNLQQILNGKDDYRQFVGRIRVALAGRAAEEIVFGADGITIGSHGDLQSATTLASQYFALAGYAPNMNQPGASGSNLAIWETNNPVLMSQLHELVRSWLATEYEAVKALLSQHRQLLDAIAEAMLTDPVQDQEELRNLWAKYAH